MKNASQYAKRLSQLLGRLRKVAQVTELPKRTPLEQLIYSFLEWNCTGKQAENAMRRLQDAMVDLNDLRVSDPHEIIEVIGCNYHLAELRTQHLKNALNAIYRREHGMAMESLAKLSKRDARAYLEGLDGMVPFVAASVVLLSLEGHAVPIDDELRKRLIADSVISPDATILEAQTFIEHHVRADQASETYQLLRAYVEKNIKVALSGPIPKPPPPAKAAPAPVAAPRIAAAATVPPTATATVKKQTTKPVAKPAAKPAAKASKPAKKPAKKPAAKPARRR